MRIFDLIFRRRRTIDVPTAPSPAAKPRTFSVSSTYEYERCPRRYRYGYVDRIPAERAAAPEHWRFGTVVHAGLEAGYRHHQAVGYTSNLRHTIPTALDAVGGSWAEEAMPDDPDALARAEAGRRPVPRHHTPRARATSSASSAGSAARPTTASTSPG